MKKYVIWFLLCTLLLTSVEAAYFKMIKSPHISTVDVRNFRFNCSVMSTDLRNMAQCVMFCDRPDELKLTSDQVHCIYYTYSDTIAKGCTLCLVYVSSLSEAHEINQATDFIGVTIPVTCPSGWYAWETSCYRRIYSSISFNSAPAACTNHHPDAIPAELVTAQELANVSPHMGGGALWIGGKDLNSDDSEVTWIHAGQPVSEDLWQNAGPTHNGDCLFLDANNHKLQVYSCSQGLHYVCEIDHIIY